jgi:hypothetical protein
MVAANVIPMEQETQPVPGKATLYAKLARVMGKVQRIEKNGHNSFHNYDYATATDIYEGVRAALAEENVAFLPDMVKAEHEGIHTRLEFDFYFVCGDTGAVKVCRWVSEADDKGDKGINKAVTFAVKYFLIATFLIATGDVAEDPDNAAPVEDKKAQPKKQERRLDTSEKPATPIATNGTKQAEIVSMQPETVATTEPEERVERAAEMLSEIMSRELFDAGYAVLVELNELKDDTTAVYIKNRVLGIIEVGAHNKKKGKAG